MVHRLLDEGSIGKVRSCADRIHAAKNLRNSRRIQGERFFGVLSGIVTRGLTRCLSYGRRESSIL